MAIQLILCVETKKSADTDSIYILDTINHWYQIDNKTKISKINMNTKTKYQSKGCYPANPTEKKGISAGRDEGNLFY